MDEKQIVELYWQRDPRAMTATREVYGRLVHKLCGNLLGDDRDAEECLNDTLLALWNAIPPLRPEPLAAYICRVARNQALTRRRARETQKRDRRLELPLDELAEVLPSPSAEEVWDAKALAQTIDRWLEEQKQVDRVLFVRRYWFGDSVQEAAQRVGLRENTASARLRRMKLRLRDVLTQEGYVV